MRSLQVVNVGTTSSPAGLLHDSARHMRQVDQAVAGIQSKKGSSKNHRCKIKPQKATHMALPMSRA